MSAFTVGSIKAEMRFNISEFRSGMREVAQGAGQIRDNLRAIGVSAKEVGRDLSLFGGAVTAFFGATIKAAADVQESTNLFEVSMRGMAASTRAWSEEVAASLGLNANSVREVAGGLNVVIGNMGLTEAASASMSKEMTKLAFDMGSFYNLPHETALEKLRAGILGESEPLKQLGIVLNETRTQAFAFANGIADVGSELTESQKVVARYGLIMEQTRLAQGDLARTSDSFTNSFRRLREQTLALGQSIGDALIPPVSDALARVNNAAFAVRAWAKENTDLAATMARTAAAIGVGTLAVGGLALGIAGLTQAFRVLATTATVSWAIVSGPIGLTVAGIAALGAAIYTVRAVWKQNFEFISFAAEQHLGGVMKKFTALRDWALGIASEIAGGFVRAWQAIGRGAATMLSMVGIDTAGIGEAAGGILGDFAGLVSQQVDKAKGAFSGFGDYVKGVGASIKAQLKEDLPDDIQGFWDTLMQGLKMPEFEGYKDLNLEELMKGATSMDALTESTKKAEAAAKKAAAELERLKEEATNMRLELFPEEAFAEDVRRVRRMAEQFPEIMTGAAIDKAFDGIVSSFEGKGVNAVKAIKAHILDLPESFAKAMEQAVQRADIAATEAMMDARALSEDSAALGRTGDSILRGRTLADSLGGAGAVQGLTQDLEDLKAAGRMDGETLNLLGKDLWGEIAQASQSTFEGMLDTARRLAPEIVPQLEEIRAAAQFDAAVASFDSLGNQASTLSAKLRELGAGGVATLVARMGEAVTSGVNIARTLADMPRLFAAFTAAGVSAAFKLGTALRIALNVLALIADAINIVISLFGDWGDEGEKELKGMAKVIDEIKEASQAWIDTLTDKFIDFVKTGQAAWREFTDQVLDDILRIATRELVVSPLVGLVGNAIGFADGGAFEKGHVVESPEFFHTKDGMGVRGEAGTEFVMPAVRLSDGTLGVKSVGGGSASAPIINVYDNRTGDNSPVEVTHRRGLDGQHIVEMTINAVQRGFIEGDFDNTLRLIAPRIR